MEFSLLIGALLILIGVLLFYLGSRKNNESSTLSRYVPVDTINSIPFGMPVVVSGTVTTDQPLNSPVTLKPCVYYRYVLERETQETDSKGNTSWVWQDVGSPELQTIPFSLQDQSGKILIKPDKCEVKGIFHTQKFLEPGTIQNVKSTGMRILAAAIQMTSAAQGNRERVTEDAIFTGAALNAFGIITMEGEQKFLQKTSEYPLVLTPLSKDQLVGSEKKAAYLYYGLGFALICAGLFFLIHG